MTFVSRLHRSHWLWVLLCLGLSLSTLRWVRDDSIVGDATQNLIIAYSLFERGDFSQDMGPARFTHSVPSDFREPVPPALTAVWLRGLRAFGVPFTLDSLHHGEHTRLVKAVNMVWVFGTLLAAWLLVWRLTRSRAWAFAAVVLIWLGFLNSPDAVDSLYTELPAACGLLWLSWALLRAVQQRGRLLWAQAGVVLGVLCLIKAVFLYLVPLLALLAVFGEAAGRWRQRLVSMALLVLGALLVVLPWMARNAVQIGSFQLTQGRSGWVLYKRAMLNQMNADEYRRAFTLWGPNFYQNAVKGSSLDIAPQDLRSRDGPLRRLYIGPSDFQASDFQAQATGRPEQAVTFYRQTSARYMQLRYQFEAAGAAFPDYAGDATMQREAWQMIRAHPWAHLRLVPLMLWRGMWCVSARGGLPGWADGPGKTGFFEGLNLAAVLALFGTGLAAVVRRRPDGLALTLPALGMLGAYTLLSQNLPRFFEPAVPVMLIVLLLGIRAAWRWRRPAPGVPA